MTSEPLPILAPDLHSVAAIGRALLLRAPGWFTDEPPEGFADAVAAWEDKGAQALADQPDFQSEFLAPVRPELDHELTARLKHQLAVLNLAICGWA